MGGSRSREKFLDPTRAREAALRMQALGMSGFDTDTSRISSLGGLGLTEGAQMLGAGELTPSETLALEQRLESINAPIERQQAEATEAARASATARGLFSSRGALAQEASDVAKVGMRASLDRVQALQDAATARRQGILGAEQLSQSALGRQIGSQEALADLLSRQRQLQIQALGQAGEIFTSTRAKGDGGGLLSGFGRKLSSAFGRAGDFSFTPQGMLNQLDPGGIISGNVKLGGGGKFERYSF